LSRRRAVKAEKHSQFADENDMYSFLLSAKTGVQTLNLLFELKLNLLLSSHLCRHLRVAGDNVSSCFYRLAADLAGVVLTKPELEV